MLEILSALSQIFSISFPLGEYSLSLGALIVGYLVFQLGTNAYHGIVGRVNANEAARERELSLALMDVTSEEHFMEFMEELEEQETAPELEREWELYDDTHGFGVGDEEEIIAYIESVMAYEKEKMDDLDLSTFGAA